MGRPPKELISILRMNKILKSRPNPAMSLTDLCYQHGYFDQAHFIHEFKEVLGMTPSQYFNNQSLAFDFYNSGRWQGDIFDPKNHLK
jgi:AraC-like DNA-binding protein